jgi:hypothetical protein
MDIGTSDLFKLVLVVGLAAAGAVRAWWGWPERVARRRLAGARARHVAQLCYGDLARVRGIVRPRSAPVRAPLTGRTAVWFSYMVEQRIDFRAAGWTPLTGGVHFDPFDIVEDGVPVTVEGVVSVFLEPDHQVDVASSQLTTSLRELLRRADIRVPADVRMHYRFSEALLPAGTLIEAGGRVSVEVDPRGEPQTFRGQPLRRFLRGTAEEPVVIGRAPKDERSEP